MADLEFYTIKDVEQILQIGHIASQALFMSEGFPGIKVGKAYRVEKKAFEQWLKNTKDIRLDYSWNGGRKK